MITINLLQTHTSDSMKTLYNKEGKSWFVYNSRLLKKPKIQFCVWATKFYGHIVIEGSLDNTNWFNIKTYESEGTEIRNVFMHTGLVVYLRAKITRNIAYTADWFTIDTGYVDYIWATY
jgi:hypothetical protein